MKLESSRDCALNGRFETLHFRGQPVKSVFPEGLLDPEDPEGPLLRGGVMPENSPEAGGWGRCDVHACC